MGFFKKLIKGAVGAAGKHLMGMANAATGGIAGKLVDTVVQGANKHAGIIGKVARGIGRAVLSDETRNKLSNFADSALKYIPGGAVKTALKKINNAAQGRDENYGFKEKHNKQLNSTEANSKKASPKNTVKQRNVQISASMPNEL